MLCEHRKTDILPCNWWDKEHKVCKHPKMFRCPEAIKANGAQLSHSSIQAYTRCRRCFYYYYILGLELIDKAVPLYIGEFGHGVLRKLHTPDTNLNIDQYIRDNFQKDESYELAQSVLQVKCLLEIYQESGLNEPKGEVEKEWIMNDPSLTGYIDMVDDTRGFEWKITTNPNYYTLYTMEDQLGTYFLGNPDKEKAFVRTFNRPTLRRGKNEKEKDYEERIKQDVRRRPSHYFKEDTYYRHEINLEAVRKRAIYIMNEIQSLLNDTVEDAFYQNKSSCFNPPCQYLSICQSQGIISYDLYKKRERKEEDNE